MLQLRAAAVSEIGTSEAITRTAFSATPTWGCSGLRMGLAACPAAVKPRKRTRLGPGRVPLGPPGREPDLSAMVGVANAAVEKLGRVVSPVAGIATTLTFGVIFEGTLRIVHVGDSRCYAWTGAGLERLTEDHTVENDARRLRLLGEIAPYSLSEARAITRCLGHAPEPEAEIIVRPLAPGVRYLFCTDGISGLVSDLELGKHLGEAADPAGCLNAVLVLVRIRGTHDNSTAVAIFVDGV